MYRLNNDLRFMNLTKIRTECDFQWNLKWNFILQQKTAIKPSVYSDNFNHNTFTMFFGRRMGLGAMFIRHGTVPLCVGLKLLRIPETI